MLTVTQHARVARKCTQALTAAIEALPDFLADTDSEAAAKIVADLIKSYISGPAPESDPASALAEIMRIAGEVAEEKDDKPELAHSPAPTITDRAQTRQEQPYPRTFLPVAQPGACDAQILSSPSRTWDD